MTREERDLIAQERKRESDRRKRELREMARGPLDLPFLLLVLILMGVGLVMLLSASFPSAQADSDLGNDPFYFFTRQLILGGIGIVIMFAISKINYMRFEGIARIALLVSLVLLLLVVIPGVGITSNGATRWLGLRGSSLRFQPSEVAKLGVILFFARSVSQKGAERMRSLKVRELLSYLGLLGIITLLMLREPHLSGAILLLGIGAAIMVVGGLNWKLVLTGVVLVAVGLYLLLYTDLMEFFNYNADRIKTWRDPFWDPKNESYQMAQSFITIGSGGAFGLGLGKSRQKFMFLPEEHNDFIFAVICEELGLVGATVIMLLFAFLIGRGYWIAIKAKGSFGSLLVVGVITQVALQTFLNLSVVSGVIPATGISLPFFSYGGTAILVQLAEMGIVLSVSRQIPAPKQN